LGYDRKREEEEKKERERLAAEQRKKAGEISRNGTPDEYGSRSGASSVKEVQAPVRLGFGATHGAPAVAAAPKSKSRCVRCVILGSPVRRAEVTDIILQSISSYSESNESTYARDKFAGQKGESCSAFFIDWEYRLIPFFL
jgi:hypothetical protein